MKVTLLAQTNFDGWMAGDLTDEEWMPEAWPEGEVRASDLIEFAGRACYRSWKRPNPETATNAGYLRNILRMGHFSVLEHGSVTFYIEEVSRSLTHELVRHRHLSFSQLSQRFVRSDGEPDFVVPPLFRESREPYALQVMVDAWHAAIHAYRELLAISEKMPEVKRKQAREAARCVLPNMIPTAIVVTGNHRTWREMLVKRGSLAADAEIRELAIELLHQLVGVEPALYQDMSVAQHPTQGPYIQQEEIS